MVAAVNEISGKLSLLRSLAANHGVDALLLQRVSSVAWVTSGAAVYVNTARSEGEASLVITGKDIYLVTNNIEAVRLDKEEGLVAEGWTFRVVSWYEKNNIISELTHGLKLGSDGLYPGTLNLSGEIAHLRVNLTPSEGERYRVLGQQCAQVMDVAIRSVRPGQTEYEIAGFLSREAEQHGVQAIVNLIATDERIFKYRHPLPTAKKLARYAMLILCGRKQGLVCSITRLVHFGPLSEEVRCRAELVARVDAEMITATRPGRPVKEIFGIAMRAYAQAGYPEEWRLHHQGGPVGYEPREYLATPTSTETVSVGQAYAWNPSITGAKSEDTFLVGESDNEIITTISGWPVIRVDMNGQTLERPAILVVK